MTHRLELVLAAASVAMFVATVLAIPWVVSRLPADWFVRCHARDALWRKVGRNVLGTLLILAGIAMLVLPGQGVLTILVGLAFVDLPLKRRLAVWLLRHPAVERPVDRLRARAGRPPFELPEKDDGSGLEHEA